MGKLRLGLGAAALVLALAGCGGGSTSSSDGAGGSGGEGGSGGTGGSQPPRRSEAYERCFYKRYDCDTGCESRARMCEREECGDSHELLGCEGSLDCGLICEEAQATSTDAYAVHMYQNCLEVADGSCAALGECLAACQAVWDEERR